MKDHQDDDLINNGFLARHLFVNCIENFPNYSEANDYENDNLCLEQTGRGWIENVITIHR